MNEGVAVASDDRSLPGRQDAVGSRAAAQAERCAAEESHWRAAAQAGRCAAEESHSRAAGAEGALAKQ
jgi:hypothetical protein